MPLRLLLLLTFTIPFAAFSLGTPQPVKLETSLAPGGALVLKVHLPDGYHAYRSSPVSIPLAVTVSGTPPLTGFAARLPAGEKKGDDRILRGILEIPLSIAGEKGKIHQLEIKVTYQLCADREAICLAPETVSHRLGYTIPATVPATVPAAGGGQAAPPSAPDGEGDWVSSLVKKNLDNPLIAFLLAILGGFLASLTPCVYPVIPITVGYFSGRTGSRGGRLAAALAYVAGMGLVYTALGVIGGLAGSAFGSFTNTPLFMLVLGGIFILLSLSLFEVYEFRLPAGLARMRDRTSGGHGGSFVMGVVTGLVASPCVGPLIVFLLTGVLQAGKPVLGAVLMAGFSIGMGILFLILALFSQSGARLPKSGNWMVRIKLVLGMLVLGSSFYFLKQGLVILGAPLWLMAGIGILLLVAVVLTGILRLGRLYGKGTGHGILLTVLAALLVLFFVLTHTATPLLWNDLPERLERAVGGARSNQLFTKGYAPDGKGGWTLKSGLDGETVKALRTQLVSQGVDLLGPALLRAARTGKPLLLDVGAVWCVSCKELEAGLARRPRLLAFLRERYVPYKADLDREGKRLKEYLRLPGVPTVAVLRVEETDGRLKVTTLWEQSAFTDLDAFLDSLEARLRGFLKN